MPSRGRTNDLTLLAIAGVSMAVLTAAAIAVAPAERGPREPGSTYAAQRDGAKAAFLMLKELRYRIDRSFDPIAAIRADPERTLLVLAEPSRAFSNQDRRALRRFIEAGGVVLAAGPLAAGILPDLSTRPVRGGPDAGSTWQTYYPIAASPLAAGAPSIEMAPLAAEPVAGSPYLPIYGREDASAVLSARIGRGRVIWLADATPLANAGIARAAHLELLLNAVGPPEGRAILWDEHYHGYTRSFASYVTGTPLPWGAAQVALVGAAAFVTFSRRRGPIRPRRVEPRTSPMEFVDTMGSLYERAGATAAAVATSRSRVRRLLAASTGLPASTSDLRLAAGVSERFAIDRRALAALLERTDTASQSAALHKREALALVAELQATAAALQSTRGPHPDRNPSGARKARGAR